jgi:hypothetical protein
VGEEDAVWSLAQEVGKLLNGLIGALKRKP